MRVLGAAVICAFALLVGGGGQARATAVCTGEYNTSNGTTTLPGTNIGQIESGCEIGPYNSSTGQNGNVSAVSASANPSIYEFTWTGGNLTIKEELGNNGIGYNIDVELGLVSAVTLNSNGSLTSPLASISIPYQSGPGAPVDVIDNMFLAAGTYALDTYLGTCANTNECSTGTGSSTDPQYQVLFSPNATATPLPATMPLFATGLGLAGMFGWRRKRKIGATTA